MKSKEPPQRIAKIKSFIVKYNYKGRNDQSGKDDWKKN